MCGRYQLIVDKNQIQAHYSFINNEFIVEPREEIYPSQLCPIITNSHKLEKIGWGITADWSKQLIINARSETVLEKPLFSESFDSERCLVIASGFYEWKQTSLMKEKQLIRVSDQDLFAMAGLIRFEEYGPRFVILTKQSNETMAPIHHRMPVILNDEEALNYLNYSKPLAHKLLMESSPELVVTPMSNTEMLTLF